jgi:16S rRNA (uracil1498-N3)-methyltransferase
MNLILLSDSDFLDESRRTARLTDRRAAHIKDVLGSRAGDSLKLGILDGPLATGVVRHIDEGNVELDVSLGEVPPRPRVTVILAMVRPQIMKRTLQHLATLGARRIFLVGSNRVEKRYFSQRLFDGNEYEEHLVLGLEQACDTWLPRLEIHRLFKPFIEDVLPSALVKTPHRFIAHPGVAAAPPRIDRDEEVALAIGPEGGWVDYEVDRFVELGFRPVNLGSRILKVETAIPYMYGALSLS